MNVRRQVVFRKRSIDTGPYCAVFEPNRMNVMTQIDPEKGRSVCVVGITPERPAEFVIFRIGQKPIRPSDSWLRV